MIPALLDCKSNISDEKHHFSPHIMAQHECYSEAAENNKYKCANSDRPDTYFLSMYSGVLILTMDLTPSFFPDRKC